MYIKEHYDTDREAAADIRKARQEKGWTQQELAELMGCSQSLIAQYEGGRSTISDYNMHKLISIFNGIDNDDDEEAYIMYSVYDLNMLYGIIEAQEEEIGKWMTRYVELKRALFGAVEEMEEDGDK